MEDPRIATIGLLSILYGLLLNLLPILATIYISAKVLGWLLFKLGILTHGPNTWFVHHLRFTGSSPSRSPRWAFCCSRWSAFTMSTGLRTSR